MQLGRGVYLNFPSERFPTKINRPREDGMSFGLRLHAKITSNDLPRRYYELFSVRRRLHRPGDVPASSVI